MTRLLLAAIECAKGDHARNLGRHVEALREAAEAGCDMAVFPEMSLTGYVAPGEGVPLDHELVRSLVEETAASRIGVGALFGMTEDGGCISQVLAAGGRVVGVYRKRHLGQGEDDYVIGDDPGVLTLPGASEPFGVAICAESLVDFPFDEAEAAGASLVCFCAAPGLHGRRRTDEEWRAGFDWWLSAGVEDCRRHAKRLGLWVAIATQAGCAGDEDFPGFAGLVNPDGEVIARLPDWRAGTLVVEVPT